MTTISSVPTVFNGVRYRSALEADWAAMFTDLGIYFEYEPQPWRLPSGAVYDCDFYLPNSHTYCEAKGPHNERLWKPREFAAALEATEYPRAFLVVVLRPAGPHGSAVWESADGTPDPMLAKCSACHYWGFTSNDDHQGAYCRYCGSHDVLRHAYFPDSTTNLYGLPMTRAPRTEH